MSHMDAFRRPVPLVVPKEIIEHHRACARLAATINVAFSKSPTIKHRSVEADIGPTLTRFVVPSRYEIEFATRTSQTLEVDFGPHDPIGDPECLREIPNWISEMAEANASDVWMLTSGLDFFRWVDGEGGGIYEHGDTKLVDLSSVPAKGRTQ